MSEVAAVKSVEPVTAEAPKIEETIKPVEPTPTETPAAAAETTTEEAAAETKPTEEAKKEEEKPEPKEITHGTLSKTHRGVLR